MTSNGPSLAPQPVRDPGFIEEHKRAIAIAAASAVLAAAGTMALEAPSGASSSGSNAARATRVGFNASKLAICNGRQGNLMAYFNQGDFMPAAPNNAISGSSDAANAVTRWLRSGPLGYNQDPGSAAAVDATTSHWALEGNAVSSNRDYHLIFQQDMALLNNVNPSIRQAEADKLCNDEAKVLGPTEAYDPNAIVAGDPYTKVVAVDSPNGITDIKLIPFVSKTNEAGVTFTVGGNTQFNGFEAIYLPDGSWIIPGTHPNPQPTKGHHNNQRTPATRQHPSKNRTNSSASQSTSSVKSGSSSTNGTGTGTATSGSTGGGVQVGNSGCGTGGSNCGGGSGTNVGNKGPKGPGVGPSGPNVVLPPAPTISRTPVVSRPPQSPNTQPSPGVVNIPPTQTQPQVTPPNKDQETGCNTPPYCKGNGG